MRGRRVAIVVIAAVVAGAGCTTWSGHAGNVSSAAIDFEQSEETTTTTTSTTTATTTPPPTLASIKDRQQLRVGVDETTMLLGYRNPTTNKLEGFEIDLAKELARRMESDGILPSTDAIVYYTVPPGQKVDLVKDNKVDMTISAVSITESRKKDVEFSTEYFNARQRFMVRKDSEIRAIDDLGRKTVCLTRGTTSADELKKIVGDIDVELHPVALRADCLKALQDGDVDAIFTHETFLYGFRVQDPNTRILPPKPGQDLQHYGIAMPKDADDLVGWVNDQLEELHDGTSPDGSSIGQMFEDNFLRCNQCEVLARDPDGDESGAPLFYPFDFETRHG